MTRKRLHLIGIGLIMCGLIALAIDSSTRRARDSRIDALSDRIGSLSVRLENISNEPKADRSTETLLAEIKDVRSDLTGIEQSYDSLVSASNLSSFLPMGLTIVGMGFLIAGSRFPRTSNMQDDE